MSAIKEILEYIFKFFQWWATVFPWERGLRVRLGKRIKLLDSGIHFKIPFIDSIFTQTIRLRIVQLPVQTVTTKDGKTLSILIAIGYSVSDICKLYNNIHQPESTICGIAMGEVSEYIATNEYMRCTPVLLEKAVTEKLQKINNYGIKYEYIKVIGYAAVKTFRLIQDTHWMPENMQLEQKK